ncbi:MAG: hypothetical protein GX415_01520 [Chloroflexi bacterium]|jgi:hypothetical protein|nr:hypothetical protein [Anaerolineaceae bacterium]NLI44088.1 hypothetical protein [Chloroflexota bacterium]HOE35505.1 hypothetical protein [Anaerolineaceae bacterium]HOT26167.1 hypothetical protein [Anaerolineaceae bacterium]HQH58514.1 hypothetical protein [Anaerolineaceae bacterium]
MNNFVEVKIFEVIPEKIPAFEALLPEVIAFQQNCQGCQRLLVMKREYTINNPEKEPRKLQKIIKSVKYFAIWEFDTRENYAAACHAFFEKYERQIARLLIHPFDIHLGYAAADAGWSAEA